MDGTFVVNGGLVCWILWMHHWWH